jgi:hypothetical protein
MLLPSRLGTVWFPLSVTFQLDDSVASESEIALRNVGLVLKSKDADNEHVVPLEAHLSQATRNALLTGPGAFRTFYSPRLFSVSKGTYVVSEIRFELSVRGSVEMRVFHVPFASEKEGEWTDPAVFDVKDGNISALPRVSLMTTFSEKQGSIVSKTKMELKDKDFIPTSLVLRAADLEDDEAKIVSAALSVVPRQRLNLTTESDANSIGLSSAKNVGFLFELPCDFSGIYSLIWRRMGDEREYVMTKEFSPAANSSCKNLRQIPVVVRFPDGGWSLLATHFSRSDARSAYEMPPLFASDKEAQQYFGAGSGFSELGPSREIDIKRKIAFRVGDFSLKISGDSEGKALMYAGRLSLSASPGDDGKSMAIATVWDRKYSLQELQKLFSAKDVYNVYSRVKLVRDQVKDQVQSVMRATSADKAKAERSLAEFRRGSAKVFADCIVEREQIDPLISVSGNLRFAGLPKASYVDFFDIHVDSDERSKLWIEECIDKRFHSFRLTEPSQTRFSGEIRFVLE